MYTTYLVAQSTEPAEAALGVAAINRIDDFLDALEPQNLARGSAKNLSEVMPKYRVARDLWGRARRSELINEAFSKAKNQASGFENGLVSQFRSIINNKKKSKFFKPNEIKAMEDVVRGTTSSNIAKLVGRLGFTEGHATNLIGGGLGVYAGAQVAGPLGAVAVPLIGQVSRKLAQRMTAKNAEFADAVVRAGENAEEISKAYIKNTGKTKANTAELSELLMRPGISLDDAVSSRNPFLREAAEIAKGNRILLAAALTPQAAPEQQEQQ